MTVVSLQVMPEEGCLVEPEELQPLLHSTSDSQIRRRDVTIDMEGLGECDTDSNKTEVEEIEMVDMEGRAEVKPFPKSKQTASFFSEIHDFPMPSI